MKISEQWLRTWVPVEIDTAALVDQLTIAGLEVDGIEHAGGGFDAVVVAEVIQVESHPDADNLSLCQVNDGSRETVQVVCGAANVRQGMKAAFARVGARLPAGTKIRKARLRGVESFGMLCSGQELGLADSASGLLELPDEAPVGVQLQDYLQLDDSIIEIDLTPNRGDCLSIAGVAREVAVINRIKVMQPDIADIPAILPDRLAVYLEAPEDCPAYTGRIIKGVNTQAFTPVWMQERLRRSGVRPISPVIDISNFVLLELGQPMHAFDLDALGKAIYVRKATAGESLVLLDGKEAALNDDVLVIADERQVLAMAGIMGGEASAVSASTVNILLEAAYFNPLAIIGRARRFGLHTESSHRFERGVDPELQRLAIERATQLVLEVCGGQAGPVIHQRDDRKFPGKKAIELRADRVRRVLGIEIDGQDIEQFLSALNCEVNKVAGGWRVTPPGYRFDVTIEADLIEEIARLHGYNRLPESRPVVPQNMIAEPENRLSVDVIRNLLADRGWQEAITYSFVDPVLQKQLDNGRGAIDISNPISSEMSCMRTSHWVGLLQALKHNQARQLSQIRLFETGLNFIANGKQLDQEPWISGIAAGNRISDYWSDHDCPMDFYDIKGDLEAIIGLTRSKGDFRFVAEAHPALHPGQTARLYRSGLAMGWLGVLYPMLQKVFDVDGPVILFEVLLNPFLEANHRNYQKISKYPGNRRDLSFLVSREIPSQDILDTITGLDSAIIRKSWIFDIYQGEGVESGLKSVSLGLILQGYSRTLVDEDVEKLVSRVIMKLEQNHGARLRS